MKEKKQNSVGTEYVDTIIDYVKKNRMQTFYNLVLLMVILIQTPFMIAGLDSVTVEVDLPPDGKVIVRNDKANKLYYRLWAEHFSNDKEYKNYDKTKKEYIPYTFSILDFDYLNVQSKYEDFITYYNPRKLIMDKDSIMKFTKNVKVKMISQNFEVSNIEVNQYQEGHKAKTIISGVAYQTYGTLKKEPKECNYALTFSRKGGKLYVESINTNCFN